MRIGEAVRIIMVEPFEDSTEVPVDPEDQSIRDSKPQKILLEEAEVITSERASDLLPV